MKKEEQFVQGQSKQPPLCMHVDENSNTEHPHRLNLSSSTSSSPEAADTEDERSPKRKFYQSIIPAAHFDLSDHKVICYM